MPELFPRIPFGPAHDPRSQAPWPNDVIPTFTIAWLEKDFVPAQEKRLRQVTEAIAEGNQRIETARAEASRSAIVIGDELPGGKILRTGAQQKLQADIASHAQQQVVKRIVEIRRTPDDVVPPNIVTMQRAAQTAQTLADRYFDKISCLSRYNAGLGKLELAQLKAAYATLVRGMAPIELARLAQNAIDDITNAHSIVLLDVIRIENFGRKSKDDRAFLNAELLRLIQIAEHDQAQPLLERVVALHNEALRLWVDFNGKTNRASTLRMGHQLGKLKLAEDTVHG